MRWREGLGLWTFQVYAALVVCIAVPLRIRLVQERPDDADQGPGRHQPVDRQMKSKQKC